MENVSVLLVADESEARARVAHALSPAAAEGLHLVDCNADARGMQRALHDPFSCVVASASVIERDGMRWLEELMATPHGPAVIAVSPDRDHRRTARLLEHGVQECLTWSEIGEVLPAAINDSLARQQRIRCLREAVATPVNHWPLRVLKTGSQPSEASLYYF